MLRVKTHRFVWKLVLDQGLGMGWLKPNFSHIGWKTPEKIGVSLNMQSTSRRPKIHACNLIDCSLRICANYLLLKKGKDYFFAFKTFYAIIFNTYSSIANWISTFLVCLCDQAQIRLRNRWNGIACNVIDCSFRFWTSKRKSLAAFCFIFLTMQLLSSCLANGTFFKKGPKRFIA